MSGSESSVPASAAASPEAPALLSFAVHSLPSPEGVAGVSERTRRGRWQMFVVLLVCAAPVVASYLAYFGVLRPQGRTNYGELIAPPRPLPSSLALSDLQGARVAPQALLDLSIDERGTGFQFVSGRFTSQCQPPGQTNLRFMFRASFLSDPFCEILGA